MTAVSPLKGMTWGHDRGLAPLLATAAAWREQTGVEVEWQVRSLKEFGEVPLADLVDRFDLLIIDHPFIGRAAEFGLARPLDDLVGPDYLSRQAAATIGPSHRSYRWRGSQYALAVDAAAQVMAVRPDLLPDRAPTTWSQVLEPGFEVGFPMNSTDVVPTFLTLCASTGEEPFRGEGVVSPEHGRRVLDLLRALARRAQPGTLDRNPIELFERMAESDEIAVVPAAFGYTNYARAGYRRHRLRFLDLPAVSAGAQPVGSTLGGAGLAISARSNQPAQAAAYAMYVADPAVQAGLYVTSGGQPGHGSAWEDDRANELTDDFFRRTRSTMDHAYLRPRHVGYLDWQDAVGPVLAEFVRGSSPAASTLAEAERLYRACLPADLVMSTPDLENR